jgi:hypothetical protein
MRQGRGRLACDFTAKDAQAVRDKEREQLLRRLRVLDHPVEIGSTLARTPGEAQSAAAEGRESETGTEPDSIGSKVDIAPGKLKTLFRNAKALAEPPGNVVRKAEAISNRHFQPDVLRLVGETNGFEKKIECFINAGPSLRQYHPEAVKYLAENLRVAAPHRELPSLSKQRGSVLLRIAQTSEVSHHLGAHGRSLAETLRRLHERVEKLADAPPVPERLGRIVEPHPLRRSPVPFRRLPGVARSLPVEGEKRCVLAELP